MSDEREGLLRAAKQLIETDELLGGSFTPAVSNPLPACEVSEGAPPSPSAGRAEPSAELDPADKAAALKELDEREVRKCTRCALCEARTRTVFGEGDPNADLVFVGEGPGQEEDRQGRPFVGRAGELLTKMIVAMGLSRERVFICNMVKCRPPGNRTPSPDEVQACWGYLVRQLQIIRPKVIVTMGNPATQNLLDTRTGITRLRGQWQELPDIGEDLAGTPVMPTFHPAYLLRQYTKDNRQRVWSDLQAVMEKIGLKT